MEGEDLFALFLAALEAVVPEITSEQRALVRGVLEGMLRERAAIPPHAR
jgi:hypothetical protein